MRARRRHVATFARERGEGRLGAWLDAAGERIGEQGVPAHEADPGLVTGRLDAEDQRPIAHASTVAIASANLDAARAPPASSWNRNS